MTTEQPNIPPPPKNHESWLDYAINSTFLGSQSLGYAKIELATLRKELADTQAKLASMYTTIEKSHSGYIEGQDIPRPESHEAAFTELMKESEELATYYNRDLEKEIAELRSKLDTQWKCETCGCQFTTKIAKELLVGVHQCSKCVECEILISQRDEARKKAAERLCKHANVVPRNDEEARLLYAWVKAKAERRAKEQR